MGPGRAWHLNFDAELELELPSRLRAAGGGAPTALELAQRVGPLLASGDVLVGREPRPGEARGRRGLAWCPTPRALAALVAAGAEPAPTPSLEVLRAVNDRAFCASLGHDLPGALFARSLEEIEAALGGAEPSSTWLIKRSFGFAGRGRLEVRGPTLSEAERSFCRAGLALGSGLQIEPRVPRLLDVSQHGYLDPSGTLVAGQPVIQVVSRRGVWQAARVAGADDLDAAERAALRHALEETSAALHRAGYFGPFGIDGFRWGPPRRFRARCEINARYSMSWAVGMGSLRPDLDTPPR